MDESRGASANRTADGGASKEEEDLVVRSTKKVKTREEEGVFMDSVSMVTETPEEEMAVVMNEPMNWVADPRLMNEKQSYRDTLLNKRITDEDEIILETIQELIKENSHEDDVETSGPVEEEEFDPCPTINISLEEAEEWYRPWKRALIVNLLGKIISLRVLQNQLELRWSKKGPIKVIDLSEDYFLVHFNEEEDYKFALFEDPWMIQDHYLIVQRWRPFFKGGMDGMRKIAG